MSHIATAFSACVRMDDQVAAGEPSTTTRPATPTSTPVDEWTATRSELAMSDLDHSPALVDSKVVAKEGSGLHPSVVEEDNADTASTCDASSATESSHGENFPPNQSDDDNSGDPLAVEHHHSQIPTSPYPSHPEVQQEVISYQHEGLPPAPPAASQQLEAFNQQFQFAESRDQQMLHLVGHNTRTMVRQQDEQQRQLEQKFEAQQQALFELTAGFRSQQNGLYASAVFCSLVGRIECCTVFLYTHSYRATRGFYHYTRTDMHRRDSQPDELNY